MLSDDTLLAIEAAGLLRCPDDPWTVLLPEYIDRDGLRAAITALPESKLSAAWWDSAFVFPEQQALLQDASDFLLGPNHAVRWLNYQDRLAVTVALLYGPEAL